MSAKNYQLRSAMVRVLQKDKLPESDTIRLARLMAFCAENKRIFNSLTELDAIGTSPFITQMLERTQVDTIAKKGVLGECTGILGWVKYLREMCGTDLELDNALEIVRSRVQTVLDALGKL